MSLSGAAGSLIDIKSHAENTKWAYEYTVLADGTTNVVPTYQGGADFEVQAEALRNTRLQSTATPSYVLITPTGLSGIPTAIMLNPFRNTWVSEGVTDISATVFPDLVGKGYATLHYTDSGASSDKFQNLGKYNVVLLDGHMESDGIGLSTYPYHIPYRNLNYRAASTKSLVLLDGCSGFDGYPAFGSAYLSGGFENDVDDFWGDDYVSYFFDALKDGNPASYANTYANNLATAKYGSGQYYLPLVFYPTNWQHDFNL